MSSWVADLLVTFEETSSTLEPSSEYSLRISERWASMVSNWVVMATMPETGAQMIERIYPSPAVIHWSA